MARVCCGACRRRKTAAAFLSLPLLSILMVMGPTPTAQAEVLISDDFTTFLISGYQASTDSYGFVTGRLADAFLSEGNPLFYRDDGTINDAVVMQTAGLAALPAALSGDGSTVVGGVDIGNTTLAFIWTSSLGFRPIDAASDVVRSSAVGVSHDGAAVTGIAMVDDNGDLSSRAFYWHDGDAEMTVLGTFGGQTSIAAAISGDGSTVIGEAETADGGQRAFVWRESTGMIRIDTGDGNDTTSAYLVNHDGSVVVGYTIDDSLEMDTFRWTENGVVELDLGWGGAITGMNRDGRVLIGNAVDFASEEMNTHAIRWVASSDGMSGQHQDIHNTLRYLDSLARDVSDDGEVIVGVMSSPVSPDPDAVAEDSRGFRWTEEDGMISVDDWLRLNGVTLSGDITETATSVSPDGTMVFGETIDGSFYFAKADGVITLRDYLNTAAETHALTTSLQTTGASTVMFGAQGSPMRNLLEPGRRSLWGTIDTGHDEAGGGDGGILLGDLGAGYGVTDGLTVRLSGGATYRGQDLSHDGALEARGWYLAPEATMHLFSGVYLTAGAYVALGDVQVDRRYLNGSAYDVSSGETDTRTIGGKVRLDWLNAFHIGEAEFSPYLSLARIHAKTDAYQEHEGAFPATYDAVEDHATLVRLGLDSVYPLTADVRLLARAEAAYRFEETAADTVVQVAGISLSAEGYALKQFWWRGGVGAELDLGGGTASLMLNMTTESEDPDLWLRSGWKVEF